VRYDEIVQQLLERFPELRPAYDELVREWFVDEPPGVYNVMDIVWQPFIERASEQELKRAFQFVEELCRSEDREARFVGAEVSWGQLGGTPLLDRARPFLGDSTRELVAKCEAEWLEARSKRKPSLWRRLTSGCS
jgi:hypothetical protein